jgi:hypothetical protein
MGDYLQSIRLFGTIDSYTSQIVHDSLLLNIFQSRFNFGPGRVGS